MKKCRLIETITGDLANAFFIRVTTNECLSTAVTYLLKEPKPKGTKPSAIILLHAVGRSERDLFSFSDQLPDNFLVMAGGAPITLGPGSMPGTE